MNEAWWKEATVYQIYPRSFNDSNEDGIGDIPGIIKKLDYLDRLGVDIVWLNPVYDSPNVDNGYDIRNYRTIMDELGTMEDWEELVARLHERDIRLIMDLAVNHTSDEHEYFCESRSNDRHHDRYIWRSPDDDGPPNNWESFFGGSAWEYDERKEAYYLHLFDIKQPDLNWQNPDVRDDVYEMIEWWLDKGVDGFRLDVINLLSKPDDLPDGDPDSLLPGSEHYVNGPRIHEYLQEMNEEVLEGKDIVTVGEIFGVNINEARKFTSQDSDGLDMVFQYEHMLFDSGYERWEKREWELADLKRVFSKWQTKLRDDEWNSLYLGNHDQPRIVSRFGDDGVYRVESAKMLATFLLTLSGTPFIYQGDEIGMTNAPFDTLADFRDVATIKPIQDAIRAGRISGYEEVKEGASFRSRDNARTPMQWANEEQAGFTEGEPWIDVNPNHTEVNVERAIRQRDSVFYHYRELIELRNDHPTFVYGDYELLLDDHEEIYAFLRTLEEERFLVVLNFFEREPAFDLPTRIEYEGRELLISNYPADVCQSVEQRDLHPYEASVYRLPTAN